MSVVDESQGVEMISIHVDEIIVDGRHRTDLGDLASLAASIDDVGLINPITLTTDRRLVSGHRRLEAYRILRRPIIRACVVRDLDTAQRRLTAELAENVCRLEMRPSEQASLGLALEEVERPKAAERKATAGKSNLPTSEPNFGSLVDEQAGEVNKIVGPAVGMSHETYRKAKAVLRAGRDGVDVDGTPLPPPVVDTARKALAEMDETKKVSGAFKKLTDAKTAQAPPPPKAPGETPPPSEKSRAAVAARVERARYLASTGHTSRQIAIDLGIGFPTVRSMCSREHIEVPADALVGAKRRLIDPERIVETTVTTIVALVQGIEMIEGQIRSLNAEKRREWYEALDPALKAINKLNKELGSDQPEQ